MELSQDQIEEFKKQIIQQIESSFSEDKKGPAIERVNTMNDEEFIEEQTFRFRIWPKRTRRRTARTKFKRKSF